MVSKRLGDAMERGNLVLGTTPPTFGEYSGGMGGGGAGMANRRQAVAAGRQAVEFDKPDRTIDPRFPRTAIP